MITAKLVKDMFDIKMLSKNHNTQNSSFHHHNLFIDLLKSNNINELEMKKDVIKNSLINSKKINAIDGIYFIEELYGSQQFPDFTLLNIKNKTIVNSLKIELKSGDKKIMWNDGRPMKDSIYLFTDNKTGKSGIFSGEYLMNDKTSLILDKYLAIIKKLNCEVKQELSNCGNDFNIYIRKANNQTINLSKYNKIDFINFKKIICIKINELLNIDMNPNIQPSNSPEITNLEEKTMKAISLFSGAGGDTIGMVNSGVNVIGFVEYNEDSINTHILNHPNCELIGKDIYNITDEKFREYKVDIIFGGFPCQSFSQGGKKNPTDPRGQLYKEFVRATRIIKPRFILGENVKGLLTRKNSDGSLIVNDIINEFESIGYTLVYKLIKCEKFGIPQKRSRVFFIGINNDYMNSKNIDIDAFLENIPETNNESNFIRSICEFSLENAIKIEKQKFLDIIPANKYIEAEPDSKDDYDTISGAVPTNLMKCYQEIDNHGISFGTRAKSTFSGIEDIDSQTHTILCAYNRMPRLFIPMKNRNGSYLRPFTINELKQIQGFPREYQFSGNNMAVIQQIGNAVPPIVVTNIINYLLL